MAPRGRPPVPVEKRKRLGTFEPGRHARGPLVAVEPVDATPYHATPLEAFDAVMAEGLPWLARTDAPALALLRLQMEEHESLRQAAMAGSTESRKMLRDLEKQIREGMTSLGLDPAARSRLGLAEVKAQSTLESLQAKRAKRAN